jgi:hypothetical protein
MSATRKRRPRTQGGTEAVTNLKTVVDSLIEENRPPKRKLARLEVRSIDRRTASSARGLNTIARRLERGDTRIH